jgi:protein-tyrosine phosphatase
VSFIRQHQARGEKVYVHCRAGHGRSAAAVFAWLLYKDPIVDAEKLNAQLCSQRNVRPGLWKQPHVREFHSWLKHGGVLGKNEHADSGDYVARTLYDNEEQDKDSQ